MLSCGDVKLVPVEHKHLAYFARERNELDVLARVREWAPLTEADQDRWLESINRSSRDRKDFMFTVRSLCDDKGGWVPEGAPSWRTCGCVGLTGWHPVNRSAEISFWIGREYRGKGYAKQALTALMGWGFRFLGLERIHAEVYAFNEASAAILQGLGFQVEGELRHAVWHDGAWHSAYVMGLLRGDD